MKVVKSIPPLDAAAEACIRRWTFKPARGNSRVHGTWVAIPIRFTLN